MKNLRLLFKLDPEVAFNINPDWVFHNYSLWTLRNKYSFWVQKMKEPMLIKK